MVKKEAGENSDTTRLIGIPPAIRFVTEPCPAGSEQTELCCRGDLDTTRDVQAMVRPGWVKGYAG